MRFFKLFLAPFSALYGLILAIRHKLFDLNLLKSESFSIPVIGIGNLELGGTGKSPMTIYLASEFEKLNFKTFIVSRGYKRKSRGLKIAHNHSTAADIGDEPLMFNTRLSQTQIIVSEKRSQGIQKAIDLGAEIVILDDCFQHRKVKPGLNLLLTDTANPFWKNKLLPWGYLRDLKSQSKRADALCLMNSTITSKENSNPPVQPAFHFKIVVDPLKIIFNNQKFDQVVCFSALANNEKFFKTVKSLYPIKKTFGFSDHHFFKENELNKIINSVSKNELILTTEKDFCRLSSEQKKLFKNSNFGYLPISVAPFEEDKFKSMIMDFVNQG